MSRVTRGIRQPSPVPNGYSGTGTVPGGYPCLTGTYHGYPGVPIPVLHLKINAHLWELPEPACATKAHDSTSASTASDFTSPDTFPCPYIR